MEDRMIPTLKDLGFIDSSDGDVVGYYKTYKGFRLFVATKKGNTKWVASVTVGRIEISIPLTVDAMWVFGFNEENNGY